MEHWWTDYPWRLVQTNLREIDMVDIDASQYVDSLKDIGATIAMINVAGIIASYPTSLPFHYQSPYLTGSSLAEIIDACHEANIRVIARTDFSKVRRPLYEAHPEWACRYRDGLIEDYNGNVHCCVNGDYQQKYALEIIREAITTLSVDGIFFNMGGYQSYNYSHEYLGMCRCSSCRSRFAELYDRKLPESESEDDPSYRRYQEFKRFTVAEQREAVISLIESVRPDMAIDRNTVSGVGFYRQESNTEIGRALPHWQYSASENTKRVVTSWPEMVSSNATVDFMGFPLRHTAVSPAEQELRLWQNLANCGGLDYYCIGRLDNHHDRSGFDAVRRVFSFHQEHFEATYRGVRPQSDVLLVSGAGDTSEYRGWYRALSEHHIPFRVCTADRVFALDLKEYRVICIPDGRDLPPEAVRSVDAFVNDGGVLVLTGNHLPESDGGLSAIGMKTAPVVRTDMLSAVLQITEPSVFPTLADTDLVAIGDTFVFSSYEDPADAKVQRRNLPSPVRLIPPHQYGPPERCYWTQTTDVPGIRSRPYGSGKAIYVPWFPGAFYHRQGYANTSAFIGDVMTELAGCTRIGGSLSPMVEVSLAEGPEATFTLLSLVNGSGHYGTSYHDPVPMRDLTIEIPRVESPERVLRLCDDGGTRSLPFAYSTGWLTITLDTLEAHAAVRIE